MTDLTKTKEECFEASFNISKLAGRISYDEGKRLLMLMDVVAKYVGLLEEKLSELNND
jgi:hypothetical protein